MNGHTYIVIRYGTSVAVGEYVDGVYGPFADRDSAVAFLTNHNAKAESGFFYQYECLTDPTEGE